MIEALREFTESLPTIVQWLGILLAGAIPFIESYSGSVIGVLAGMSPFVAVPAAIVGNVASMLILVLGAAKARDAATRNREQTTSPKRAKLKRMFDKYGVAGVSLLGQTVLPSQITSVAMVSFGASKDAVIRWQIVSIILWGVAFGTLATLGADLLTTGT
ncbi:hypothetical protein [Ruania halotolerans]|uniref:hypothetical protein n=1 Tax=Ruania halotolerans TaxID=2897773 RepID=UPI001E478802|nr:hypothetical protein [Ruania halotolerans]UFU07009.1 hypothetical protein LQF10_02545 [Ruania halotolerans]